MSHSVLLLILCHVIMLQRKYAFERSDIPLGENYVLKINYPFKVYFLKPVNQISNLVIFRMSMVYVLFSFFL
jgi:hypothetical protein